MNPRFAFDEPVVAVVAYRPATATDLVRTARELGFTAHAWTNLGDCLAEMAADVRGCLLIDHASVDVAPETLMSRLEDQRVFAPVVYLWPRCDVPLVVRAMRAGALGGVKWPGPLPRLEHALREAMAFDAAHHAARRDEAQCRRRLARLDEAERRLLAMLASGLGNKDIAFELNVCLRTAEDRRAKLLARMKADSLSELIRQAIIGARPPSRPQDWGVPFVPMIEPAEQRAAGNRRAY